MTIKLYSWPRSSGARVAWALEELALPYEYVALDPKKQEHRSPEMLALNPHGKVPTLTDGELKLFESGAMLLYLGNRYGAAKGLWPEPKGQAHAEAVCWTVWAMTELGSYMMQYLYHGLDTPVSYKPADRSKAHAEYNRSQLERLLDALEARLARLMRARTPEDALAVVLRLLLAQRLADTEGLPGADRQGVYEPQELVASKVLDKLARRVAPASVKRHLAEQEAERERREEAWREQEAAKLAERRAALAAGEPVRCACCFQPIASSEDATEKHGSLVHRGECEQEWGSGLDQEEAA